MRRTFLLLVPSLVTAVLIASCGGAETEPFGNSSGSGGTSASAGPSGPASGATDTSASAVGSGTGAGGEATSATGTSGTTASGAGGAGGGPDQCHAAMGDCKTQLMDLRAKLGKAKACNPNGGNNQCQQTIQGPCCAEAVNDASSPEVKCFLETLQEVLPCVGCTPECPPVMGECSNEGQGGPHCI